ncbi:MAG TPA: response regulator, partial [Longimicrobiales bacterium]|nr:response regulator [Longimicrobiales bacterium]
MGSTHVRVLLVDADSEGISRFIEMLQAQRAPRFQVEHTPTIAGAERHLRDSRPDVILLELSGWQQGGLPMLALLQAIAPAIPIIVTAPSDQEHTALKAVNQGAQDYVLSDQVYDTLLVRA